MDTITGHIERITFQNPDNGWTVARLQEPGKLDLTTVVGTMTSVQVGESLRCEGNWKNDTNFGFQFVVQTYEVTQPATIRGIQKYLASGMIKGIGDHFAEQIVLRYGEKTLDVIDQTPDLLMEIDGIGPKRFAKITAGWAEQKAIREVMSFLMQYEISPTYAQKVFKTYGEESIAVLQENPYRLARDIWGIGFKTADKTALKLGIPHTSDMRIDAGVEYVLNELSNDGHTCYPVDKFLEQAQQLLEVEANLVAARLAAIEQEERIVTAPLTIDGTLTACVWLKGFHVCEQGIGNEMRRLQGLPPAPSKGGGVGTAPPPLEGAGGRPPLRSINTTKAVAWAEQKLNIQLADNQRIAVAKSLTEKVHIITGGPGTGKSTITKVILLVSHQLTQKIMLAAPTGRAAKRMSEITGLKASTIHSLLEFDFSINGFKRNRENPLDCDLLIVDEASMIDTVLMFNLLKAVPTTARLVLVGDVDQLPSVGAGSVLQDLILSEKIPTTRLTEIFRQAQSSKIIVNAHRINAGMFPDLSNDKGGDFFFMEEEDPDKLIDLVVNLVDSRLPKAYGFDSFDDIQVLAPMNRGTIGNRNLNDVLQKKLNPSYDPLVKMGRSFHDDDKVMQIKNNYDKDVYNGDVGRIKKIDKVEQEVVVLFDGREVFYDFTELDELTLAYAVSIHKYQGSECPCVVMPLVMGHYMMLYRNLIYTGITRGKKLVILVGSKKAVAMAVKNDKAVKRITGLGR
ncbi:MAG: ATP-dependent RecD-like DNA helicase [Saprospiraceae bacterium]|nr:ATP-dependent RecD-like DNA helicase [Saprospiraceae bacterium]